MSAGADPRDEITPARSAEVENNSCPVGGSRGSQSDKGFLEGSGLEVYPHRCWECVECFWV